MMKLYFASAIALCLWLFSLPGHTSVVWDDPEYDGPRPPTQEERQRGPKGIIWKCERPGCPGYLEVGPEVIIGIDLPTPAFLWWD